MILHSLQMTINHQELWSMKKEIDAYDWLLYNRNDRGSLMYRTVNVNNLPAKRLKFLLNNQKPEIPEIK